MIHTKLHYSNKKNIYKNILHILQYSTSFINKFSFNIVNNCNYSFCNCTTTIYLQRILAQSYQILISIIHPSVYPFSIYMHPQEATVACQQYLIRQTYTPSNLQLESKSGSAFNAELVIADVVLLLITTANEDVKRLSSSLLNQVSSPRMKYQKQGNKAAAESSETVFMLCNKRTTQLYERLIKW